MENELQYNLGILDSFLNLKRNWNGNGAVKFTESHIDLVKSLIKTLSYQPEVFPTARESVLLEYDNDKGEFLSFEIRKNGRIDMFGTYNDGKTVDVKINKEDIIEKINQFYK
jgi:hypothetical protein